MFRQLHDKITLQLVETGTLDTSMRTNVNDGQAA